MKKIWITSDCTCDMPEALLEKYNVEVIHFYISTDHGCFKDTDEMTAGNVVEYFENGGVKINTEAPAVSEYEEFFRQELKKSEELIHIVISSKLSNSYRNAVAAAEQFGNKVKVYDSMQLSVGMAYMVMCGVKMAQNNQSSEEILEALDRIKDKVSTSFIVENADYLYRAGRVNKFFKEICTALRVHPVLGVKQGELRLKTVQIGNYRESVMKYARAELKRASQIERECLFIPYTTASVKMMSLLKKQVSMKCSFEKIYETRASATITSNCGGNAIGIALLKE